MRPRTLVLALLCVLFAAAPADAQRKKLSEGDVAPGLDIDAWFNGEATTIEKDHVYVIAFWSTSCVPCRRIFPLLSEIQDRYEDYGLAVIAVSPDEKDVVERFTKVQGSAMRFRVAVDRRETTTRAWKNAAGLEDRGFIAFIVGQKGKVQYIGTPGDEKFDGILRMVVDGRYDAELFRRAEPMFEAAKSARKIRNWRMSMKMLDDILKTDPHVFAFVTLDKFEMLLIDMDDPAAAYAYARTLLSEYADDPSLLGSLAEKIATDTKIPVEHRDLDFALEAAKAAAASANPNEPRRYSIQALVLFQAGRIDEAIDLQRRAWFVARPKEKAKYKRVLQSYQAAASRAK